MWENLTVDVYESLKNFEYLFVREPISQPAYYKVTRFLMSLLRRLFDGGLELDKYRTKWKLIYKFAELF